MEISNSQELKAAINLLEQKKMAEKTILTRQYHLAYESLKPVNILKTSLNKIVNSPDVTDNIIDTSMSVGAGLLSKKILVGKSTGTTKKLLGVALELAVAGLVAKNTKLIKSESLNLLSRIFKSKRQRIQSP